MSNESRHRNRGVDFIHLIVKSLIPKIEQICHLPELTNSPAIGAITETNLNGSALSNKIALEGYYFTSWNFNRERGYICFIKLSVVCSYKPNMLLIYQNRNHI